MHGGKTASAVDKVDPAVSEPEPGSGDLLSDALAGAQGMARTRPRPRRSRGSRSRDGAEAGRGGGAGERNQGGYSGPGPDQKDPQLVGELLAGYVDERGWEQPLAAARVFADWAGLVGDEVAAHCRPATLAQGELRVEAESTAWATQLRLLASTVLARLVGELGPDVVTKVHFTGPLGPSWKHGPYSVRGSRGPRDTYG
jgi:predicted nucleic acid-binding Zn ribbon protein